MASTQAGRQATERHRLAQLALRAATLQDLLKLWPAFNPFNIDQSWPALRAALMLLVRSRRATSAGLAAAYYAEFAAAEGIPNPGAPSPQGDIGDDRLQVSLDVTGPSAFKRSVKSGNDPEAAKAQTLVSLSGSVSRLVLDGGRDTITTTTTRSRQALGWARVTDGDPCYFCAMLASRGPVYNSERSATRTEDAGAFHDHCGCTAEPVFSRDAEWPGKAREYADLWARTTKGLSGRDAVNAFRAAIEGRSTRAGTGQRASGQRGSDRREGRGPEQIRAELSALETNLARLEDRQAAGEDVSRPIEFHRQRIAALRRELSNS